MYDFFFYIEDTWGFEEGLYDISRLLEYGSFMHSCPLIAWASRTNKVCMIFNISKCIFSWRTESTLSVDWAGSPQGKRKTLLAQIWAQIHNNVLIFTSFVLFVSIEYQSPPRLAPSSVFCEPQTRINCKSIEQSTTDQ